MYILYKSRVVFYNYTQLEADYHLYHNYPEATKMLFNYQLRPLKDVQPWLDAAEDPFLHWFALTDGWYWLEIDDKELLKYTDDALKTMEVEFGPTEHSYVDYYAARLWEDLLDVLPQALNPLPQPLIERLEHPMEWVEWLGQVEVWLFDQDEEDEEPFDLYFRAAGWWSARLMDFTYLNDDPLLYVWREKHDIHLYWNSQDSRRDAKPVWQVDDLSFTLPIADFRREVKQYNNQLLQEMSERISELLGSEVADYEGIDIDPEEIKQEQRARSKWLDEQIDALPSDDWDLTLKAIAVLEQRV